MEKPNESRSLDKSLTLETPSDSHPSLSSVNTSGSSPENLSNADRTLHKGDKNSKQMADKSVQTDPIYDPLPPLLIEELKKQTNFLVENLRTFLTFLEPDFPESFESSKRNINKSNDISNAGDVDSNTSTYPAICKQPNPNNHTSLGTEQTGRNQLKRKSDILKEKLSHILDCAMKIKNAIPTKLQYSNNSTPGTLHMPTGAIVTPPTQTEPVNTYIKFLQVIDDATGFGSERVGTRSKFTPSPRRPRKRISHKTHTVDTTGHQPKSTIKSRSTDSDRKSSHQSLENVLDETLNRKSIKNLSRHSKPGDIDVTLAKVMSNQTANGWSSENFTKTSEKSQSYASASNQQCGKIPKMASADAISTTWLEDKRFYLKDYIAALKEVSSRSPSTKRIREFTTARTKAYFDFDDYYQKLIDMNNNYKLIDDSINSYYS